MNKEFEQISVKPGFMKQNGGLLFKTISEKEYHFKAIINENHLNAAGITHRGFIAAFVDAGAGTAAHRSADNSPCVTISLELKFISAVHLGKELVGKAKKDEVCVYCIPAKPIDQTREVSYHEDVLKQIIETYGYNVKVIEESVALAYEGLVDNDLTGIAISMGAGMCNVCVMYQGMSALSFSVARGGDWIDECVANDCGVTKAKVISIKESSKNLDLTKSAINDIYNEGSDEYNIINAIRSYYGALVNYLLTNLTNQFNNAESVPNFPDSIPIVFGGGTSLVKGFMEVVGEQFNQDEFPIDVKEFTLVEDAHTAVARGCLSEAQLIEEEDGETEEKSA